MVEKTRRAGLNWQRLGLRLAGAGLLAVTGAIHLDLYLTAYRSIPVIGPLFLLQVIAAFGLAAAVLASGSRLAAAAGAGFALSTLGGYLLSVSIGLFGFKEIRTTAGIVAGVIEVAAFAALAMLGLSPAAARRPAGPMTSRSGVLARLQAGVPGARAAAGSVGCCPGAAGHRRCRGRRLDEIARNQAGSPLRVNDDSRFTARTSATAVTTAPMTTDVSTPRPAPRTGSFRKALAMPRP
jgi:hypothetical protein